LAVARASFSMVDSAMSVIRALEGSPPAATASCEPGGGAVSTGPSASSGAARGEGKSSTTASTSAAADAAAVVNEKLLPPCNS